MIAGSDALRSDLFDESGEPLVSSVDLFEITPSGAVQIGTVGSDDAINNDPTAVDDAYTIDEDNPLIVNVADGVLDNDSDIDGHPLRVTVDTDVSNGRLNLNTDGSFEYIPNADFTGSDSFIYQINDGNGGTDTATVDITINPVESNAITVTNQQDDLTGAVNDDIILGLLGADTLTGNGGSDTFVYNSFRDGIDTITDFGQDDFIDLSAIFSSPNYSSGTPFEDYVELAQVGSDTQVRVNPVGDMLSGVFSNLITLENVTANDLNASNILV